MEPIINDNLTPEVRMALLESAVHNVDRKVDGLSAKVGRMDQKLDDAISCKADRSDIEDLREGLARKADAADFGELKKLLIGILVSVCGTAVLLLVTIVLFRLGLN
jgi:hypothetical protein